MCYLIIFYVPWFTFRFHFFGLISWPLTLNTEDDDVDDEEDADDAGNSTPNSRK